MDLQKRDLLLLHSLSVFGALISSQIKTLHFNTNVSVMYRRLRILLKSKFIQRLPLFSTHKGANEQLYFLGTVGSEYLGIDRIFKPRRNMLQNHRITSNNILIKILFDCQDTNINCDLIPEFIIRQNMQNVIPDGAFMLTRNDKSALHFLEIDSGTEMLQSKRLSEDFELKLIAYKNMFEQNSVDFYSDMSKNDFNRFRLLIITNSPGRMKNISKLIKQYDEVGYISITTKQAFNKEGIFGDILLSPAVSSSFNSLVQSNV